MIELLWFAGGAVVAGALVLALWHRRERAAADDAALVAHRRARHLETVETLLGRYRERIATAEAELRQLEVACAPPPAPPDAGPAAAAPAPTAPPAQDQPAPPDAAPVEPPPATQLSTLSTAPHPEATTDEPGEDLQAPPLMRVLSRELANIVSAVEGGAYLLIESAPLPPTRTPAAEGLWLAVRRLRRFHDKVEAFVAAPAAAASEPIAVEPLLGELRDELETGELGLQMAWNLPRTMPRLHANHDALLNALLFLSQALLQLEQGALRLSIHVEPCFEDDPPMLELELQLEYDEDPGRSPEPAPPAPAFQVARVAAENLLRGHGATVQLDHQPGHAARALVRLPVEAEGDGIALGDRASPRTPAHDPLLEPAPRHDYGGVLVLESDPTVRSMVASELKARGRAVFACADGAAARSLMQATPDRFEMLVVDQASRLGSSDALATTATRLCPAMKVFVLSDSEPVELPPEIAARVRSIRKPFGLHDLRRALADVLAD